MHSSVRLVANDPPKVQRPKMLCDDCLHPKLDKFPLTSCMNRHFTAAVIGRPGSGKTSLVESFLRTKALYNKVFDSIYVFIPKTSLASIDNSVYSLLPKEQVFHKLSPESLHSALEEAKKNGEESKNTLIIFDDVQQFMKDVGIQKQFTDAVNNRRHLRCSMFVICQNYKKMPKDIRHSLSDIFCFNLSEDDLDAIKKEVVSVPSREWESMIELYNLHKTNDNHRYIYICVPKHRFFIGFDEVEFGTHDQQINQENDHEESKDSNTDESPPKRARKS